MAHNSKITSNMELITNSRGQTKLCYEDHSYVKKNASKSTIRWQCSRRCAESCKGALVTDLGITMVKSTTPHSHGPDPFRVEASKVRAEIMAAADANRGQPGQILADKLVNHPVQVRAAVGKPESVKRAIRRAKRGTTPAEPPSMATVPNPLPEPYTTTTSEGSETFLVYDNGSKTSRLLVFASETGLDLLGNADVWYMDGTHSTAPAQFAQLFCIRVQVGGSYGSVVYALLPGKKQEHYEECLTATLDACLRRDVRPNPVKVVADYELGIHNAVQAVISPNIHIQGCFYHLTQATWRHIQAEGLTNLYKGSKEISHFCGMLDGLAFLPVEDVLCGMAFLKKTAPEELAPLVDYFDATYVSGAFRTVTSQGRMRFRRTLPRYQPETWNVHDATITDEDRTNNVCESWNNGFRHLVGHDNPSLWTLVTCLQKDNAMVETDVYRVGRGEPVRKRLRKKTVIHQQTMKRLCVEYVHGTKSMVQFLNSVGSNIRIGNKEDRCSDE